MSSFCMSKYLASESISDALDVWRMKSKIWPAVLQLPPSVKFSLTKRMITVSRNFHKTLPSNSFARISRYFDHTQVMGIRHQVRSVGLIVSLWETHFSYVWRLDLYHCLYTNVTLQNIISKSGSSLNESLIPLYCDYIGVIMLTTIASSVVNIYLLKLC